MKTNIPIFLFSLIIFLVFNNDLLGQYCSASGGGDEYISGVEVGTISNTGTGEDSYTDYTAQSTDMTIGTGYTLTITNGNGYSSDECYVWIDWNQDNDFYDAGEEVLAGTGTGPYTATVTPPGGATIGTTTMRVRIEYSNSADPCGSTTYGEVEDYTINVLGLVNCSGTPNAGTATPVPTNICSGESSTITFTGYSTENGISFQWQSATSIGGPYSDISGETSTTYIASPTVTTYYQCVSTCSYSGLSNSSSIATVTLNPPASCYCTSTFSNTTDDWITNVTFNTINNTTGQAGAGSYGDYTILSTDITQNNSYNLSVSFESGTYTEHVFAWIDWNQNGNFTDAGEEYDLGSGASTTLNLNITVPLTATTGPTRMRITEKYSTDPTSCESATYGETEDYTVNVIAASSCTGTPTAGSTSCSVTPVCSGSSSTLTLTGYTSASGITFQWQSSTTGGPPWTNISGATSYTCDVNPTVTTSYQCVVTCTNSGLSSTSTSTQVVVTNCYLISDPAIVSTCTGKFYDSGGATGQYGNSESYTKTFVVGTPGYALQFTFNDFNTESGYDYLYVYDGGTTSSPQVAGSPFTGSTLPAAITSSGDSLTFEFISDGLSIDDGWEAVITCITIPPPDCITYDDPANGATGICPGTVSLSWTPATTGFNPTGYKLYFGTDNPPTNIYNGIDIGNVTNYDVTNLSANTIYRWRIEPYNGAGANTGCSVQSFTTANVEITSTNSPVTTCQNSANLTATGSGTINWYDVPSGGTPIATGSPYLATFSGNTTYYVSASMGSPTNYNVGKASWESADGYYGSSDWGIRFTTDVPLTINSVDVYVQTAGSDVIVKLQDNSGTDLNSITFSGLPSGLNTLSLNQAVNTPGDYRLVTGNSTYLGRDWTGISFPYTEPGVISLTSSEYGGTTTSTYYFFYNWSVTANGACESARVPVNVIHTADPITITPSGPTTFMSGGSVDLNASSSASPPYTYTWSPATGLSSTTGANVTASPTTTTTYTVTGTNGSCTNTEDITITVTYPCSGLGTGEIQIASLPYTHNSQTTCGQVDDITSSNAVVCGSSYYYTGEDVVYVFTPSTSGNVTINLTSSGTWTGIMLYDGCPMIGQGGTCVASVQNSTGDKFICVNLTGGITYYLIIDSYASPTCNPYSLYISAPNPSGSTNDLPCDATPIAIGGIESGDNTCATGTGEPATPSCWSSGSLNTLWYSFVAPASGTVKVKTGLGSLAFTQIAAYEGNCSSLTMISGACNQNEPGACSGTNPNSALTLTGLTPGTTYYIRVDGEDDYVGTFSVILIDGTQSWSPVPQQDCETATQICNDQTIVGDPGFLGVGTVCDVPTYYSCLEDGELNSAWYLIEIANTGDFIFVIDPNDNTTDYDWGLWDITSDPSGACTNIQAGNTSMLIRCNSSAWEDQTGLSTSSSSTYEGPGYTTSQWCMPVAATAGDIYLLHIQNWSSNNTGFVLDLTGSAAGVVNYTTPPSVTWTGGASTDWFNPVNWGGCAIPSCSIDAIIVNGPANQPVVDGNAECKSIDIEAGSSLTINANRQLRVCEDFSNLGTLSIDPTATILMNTSIVQNFDGNLTGTNKIGNLTATKTSGSIVFNQDITIGGNLTTSNTTSIINTNGKNIQISGNILLSSNSTFTNVGTTGALEFIGTGAQTYNTGTGTYLELNDVIINNTGTGITLQDHLVAGNSGTFTFINGIVHGNGNIVGIINSNNNAINSGNTNSYVNGTIRKYVANPMNGLLSLPVGDATHYALAQINANSLTGITYLDAQFLGTFTNTGSLNPSLAIDNGTNYNSICTEGIWQIDPTPVLASGTYDILLTFDDGLGYDGGGTPYGDGFLGIVDNEFGILKRPSSSSSAADWVGEGSGTLPPNGSAGRLRDDGYARRNGITSFSQFAIGIAPWVLPVELVNFTAFCKNNEVTLNWSTASETNNSYFEIRKSFDLEKWESIGIVAGNGNTNSMRHYAYRDQTSTDQISYYQLIQVDYDGTESFSEMISTDCKNIIDEADIHVINNNNNINIIFSEFNDQEFTVYLMDCTGKILSEQIMHISDSQNKFTLYDKSLRSGLYNLVFTSNSHVFTKQIIIAK